MGSRVAVAVAAGAKEGPLLEPRRVDQTILVIRWVLHELMAARWRNDGERHHGR
jgi:hypothetical protein